MYKRQTEISQLDGLGRKMPFTFAAFLIGALSIIGLPPFGGVWSKWAISVGALEAGYTLAVMVLMISSLLNVAYLLPIVGRAFFLPAPKSEHAEGHGPSGNGIAEAPMACVVPLCITAGFCVILFFFPNQLEALIRMALVTPGGVQ